MSDDMWAGKPVPQPGPCPSWCSYDNHHEFDTVAGSAGGELLERIHCSTTLASVDADEPREAITVAIVARESVDRAGGVLTEPPRLWLALPAESVDLTSDTARALADALTAAAGHLDSL